MNTDPLLYSRNLAKTRELRLDKQAPCYAAMGDAWKAEKYFEILSARRTADYQHYLWQSGRGRKGPIVTEMDGYIKISKHQLGLAIDIKPLNCSYQDIAVIFAKYGITHPFPASKKKENRGFIDEPHFEFDRAFLPPTDYKERLKTLEDLLKNESDINRRTAIQKQIVRLKQKQKL